MTIYLKKNICLGTYYNFKEIFRLLLGTKHKPCTMYILLINYFFIFKTYGQNCKKN